MTFERGLVKIHRSWEFSLLAWGPVVQSSEDLVVLRGVIVTDLTREWSADRDVLMERHHRNVNYSSSNHAVDESFQGIPFVCCWSLWRQLKTIFRWLEKDDWGTLRWQTRTGHEVVLTSKYRGCRETDVRNKSHGTESRRANTHERWGRILSKREPRWGFVSTTVSGRGFRVHS